MKWNCSNGYLKVNSVHSFLLSEKFLRFTYYRCFVKRLRILKNKNQSVQISVILFKLDGTRLDILCLKSCQRL